MVSPFSRSLLVTLSFLFLGFAILPSDGDAAEPPSFEGSNSGAIAGLLVLRNGNVLSGHVIRLSDHYQVVMSNGQLRVPVNQVDMFCHNLDEAYAERRRLRIGSTADSHLELAQWCMRLKLYEHTARELRDARAIDPGHRKLAMLESRLQHVQQTEKVRRSNNVPSPRLPASVAINTATSQPQDHLNSIRHLPQRERAMFVRQIQPMLVKSCATTGCHQSGSAREWQLNRLAVDGAGHPQATVGNLNSTLAQIDWQVPQESPLIDFARNPHGSLGKSSSQPLRLRQLQLLRSWLEQLAASSQALDLADKYAKPAVENRSPQVRLQIPKSGLKIPASIRDRQGVRTASAAVEDPFDPEVFNRRYARTAKPASEQSQPDEQIDQAAGQLPSSLPSSPQTIPDQPADQ